MAALAFAKASLTLMIIAIKPLRWVMLACYGMLVFISLWGIASIFALAFQCNPDRWSLAPNPDTNPQTTCVDQYTMQLAIRVLDIMSDVVLVVLPVFMMQAVQVTWRKRWLVIGLFALRLAWVFWIKDCVSLSLTSDPGHPYLLEFLFPLGTTSIIAR